MVVLRQVQDKIGFIVNNLSQQNLEQKAEELRKVLDQESWPWFANYMVVKRAAQEPNFHALYLQVGPQFCAWYHRLPFKKISRSHLPELLELDGFFSAKCVRTWDVHRGASGCYLVH